MRLVHAVIPSLLIGTALLGVNFDQSAFSRGPAPAVRQMLHQDSMRAARQPETIALVFYADWCPSCKVLGPKVEQVRPEFKDKAILWVTIDQSDKQSKQAEYLAAALGAADLWKDNGGKTGFVLLIDAKTRSVVGKLMYDQEPEQIRQTLASVKG